MNYAKNKNKTKNLIMFPVLIGKSKTLKQIHTFRRKRGMVCQYPSANQQMLVTGSIIQIFLIKSQIYKFILIFLYIYPFEQYHY